MKKCELCKMEARTLCESDSASLCWKCDSKVHGANFLVARHTRYLICALCHSPTPWSASGPYLPPSVSLCHRCSNHDQEEKVEEGEGENHILPLSSHSPPTCSSSSTQEYDIGVHELEGVHTPSVKRPLLHSTKRNSSFILQKDKGLTRRSERREVERRVDWSLSCGTAAKRFRRSCDREECEGLDDDSSENSRTS